MNRLALSRSRLAPCLALMAPLVFLSGCERAEIDAYVVPREHARLLGLIVITDDDVWMFKLLGEATAIGGEKDNFMKFARSIQFPEAGPKPVAWTLPEGWHEEPGRGMRYASLYIREKGLVVTVFKFGSESSSLLLQNVNRWRSQLNLPAISGDELLALPTEKFGDARGWILDLEGKTIAEQGIIEPEAPSVPTGWNAMPTEGKLFEAGYRIQRDGQTAEVTVTPLGGPAGGLVQNVNRWRDQVGLAEASESEIRAAAKSMDVAGVSCVYVDLAGPTKQRILAVICPKGERTWFFKMTGPVDLVNAEKTAFEEFVRGYRLGGR